MSLSTLVFIKETLEAEVANRKNRLKEVQGNLSKKEEEAGVSWNTSDRLVSDDIKSLRKIKESRRVRYQEAQDALDDFLRKAWN